MNALAVTISGLIVAVLVIRAFWVMRQEARMPHNGRPRGIAPGNGYEEIVSDYTSGAGGGSRQVTRVPRDPQEYARAFVPRRNKER